MGTHVCANCNQDEDKCRCKFSTPKPAKVPKPPSPWKSWLDLAVAFAGSSEGSISMKGMDMTERKIIGENARLELAALRKQARKGGGK